MRLFILEVYLATWFKIVSIIAFEAYGFSTPIIFWCQLPSTKCPRLLPLTPSMPPYQAHFKNELLWFVTYSSVLIILSSIYIYIYIIQYHWCVQDPWHFIYYLHLSLLMSPAISLFLWPFYFYNVGSRVFPCLVPCIPSKF